MPSKISGSRGSEDGVYHVLLTGFGPFRHYKENPAWLAVKPLHNTTLALDPYPVVIDGQIVTRDTQETKNRTIKISALEIPMEYEAVVEVVPGLHHRPPELPEAVRDDFYPLPADKGYDFIFHLGVAGRGPLRMEKSAHKLGYHMKDATGKLAPMVRGTPIEFGRREDEVAVGDTIHTERIGFELVETGATAGDTYSARPNRGFGTGYEKFADEIYTDIDVSRLVHDLRRSGIEQIYSSMDAGHYLCDFIYYCSLAESKRNGKPYEKDRNTQVLFVHVPPVGQPLTTEDCTEAIKRIIIWVCTEVAEMHNMV
ncbi:hypothetical protein V5O48_001661 [Marasmius crinis-equi]|uniref:Peptidase C15, pyroglutamyl peptidase I-like protein n=1 Tax=Marasmius crinis-equi TaxID=585013 RepID=A0ABR3FXP5_9AGAR